MEKKFWIVLPDSNNFKTLLQKESVENWMNLLDSIKKGNLVMNEWKKRNIHLHFDNSSESIKKPVPDFTRGIILKAISNRAKLVLASLLQEQVEFLPFNTDEGIYFEMNVKQVECINTELSIAKYYPQSNKIMRVEKYSFYWENLLNIHIFCAKEIGINPLFVSDEFKQVVESNNLQGFIFKSIPLV